jgi:hypothetical protein
VFAQSEAEERGGEVIEGVVENTIATKRKVEERGREGINWLVEVDTEVEVGEGGGEGRQRRVEEPVEPQVS